MNKKILFAGIIAFFLITTLFTPSTAFFDKLPTDRSSLSAYSPGSPFAISNATDPALDLPIDGTNHIINETRLEDRTPVEKCGDISTDTTWVADTYVLTCTVNILSGSTLIIEPGAVIKAFNDNIYAAFFGLKVEGSLSAVGTSDLPIVFTSLRDDTIGGDTNNDGDATTPTAGDWTRIGIDAGGSATLDHVLIRFAGGYIWPQSLESIRNAGGSLSLQNSAIEFGGGSAIRSDTNGVIDIQDSLIQNNAEHGLYYLHHRCGCSRDQEQYFHSQHQLCDLLQSPRYAHPGWNSNEREHRYQQWHQWLAPGWHFGRRIHPQWRPWLPLCVRWNDIGLCRQFPHH